MEIESKIKRLLAAWVDYIRLENLSNAKVESGSQNRARLWESGVRLVGDCLHLDKSLFEQLKQQLELGKHERKHNDLHLAVAFPQLYQVEEGKRQFYPLFAIDISSIFEGKYHRKGWDLCPFKFQPILPNLMKWYGLEEEEAESLVTQEGLKVFLKTTFNYSFPTLQDFVDWLELPPAPIRSKPSPYLLDFSYSAYNSQLKKDYAKIATQSPWDWAVPGSPAYECLFGRPQPPNSKAIFLGAFPILPPNDEQALALKHAQFNSVTAVIGPPGNGKTALLLHQIALQVVKRAERLAREGIDESNLTLVTSVNNRAVSNVEMLLVEKLPGERFYLSGGSQELIDRQVIPKLVVALDWLSKESFNRSEWESTKEKLLAGVREFQVYREQDEFWQRRRRADEQQLDQERRELRRLEETLTNFQNEEQRSHEEPFEDYSQFPLQATERIARQLNLAWHKLARRTRRSRFWYQRLGNWLLSAWYFLTFQSERAVISRLNQSIREDVALTKETPFPMELILNRKHLQSYRQVVVQQLEAVREWKRQQKVKQGTASQFTTLQRQLADRQHRLQELQNRLATYPVKDFDSRFYADYHELQVQLFEWSWHFLQHEALRRKERASASLRTYIDVLNGNRESFRQLSRFWQEIYSDISLLFPVFLSTLHSLRRLFPVTDWGCIDRLLMDEVGQIPFHLAFPALIRSRRALVVGDPFQLEPVIPLNDQKKDEYRQDAFLSRGLTEADYDRYSSTVCTAYHRAAGASGQLGDLGSCILLKEHYRCVPVIASFCDHLCNYGMIIKTEDNPSRLGANLIAYHVEGERAIRSHSPSSDYVNCAELEVVEALVEELLDAGYSLHSPDNQNTIGVVSPYRAQADALRDRLQSRWEDFPNDSIGTVHTFQGGQKSVMILSTRQHSPRDRLWFINRRPNLLNVAVSRARELLLLVGNLKRLREGGYTRQLVEYIEQWGEVRWP